MNHVPPIVNRLEPIQTLQACVDMATPQVSIIIPNWNGKDVLHACLNSASELDYPNYGIVVVDNGSTDGSQNIIRRDFPHVHLIENEQNLGYGEGQNIGIRFAMRGEAKYVFILNNDITLDRNALKKLVAAFENDASIGIAGPVLYHADRPTVVQAAGAKMSWGTGRPHYLKWRGVDGASGKTMQVDYAGMFLASTALFKRIGCFDPAFFAYWEDVDLCERAKKVGYKIVCVCTAKVWHKEAYTGRRALGLRTYYHTRNRFWIEKRYASPRERLLFYLFFFLGAIWFDSMWFLFFDKNVEAFKALLKGASDGLIQNG